MKRRNADPGKMRRPLKRNKPNEGMFGNSLTYLKFIMFWAAVVLADYMLEFRFEFLLPFWMMIKSCYESFKYHGVAFSVFFICVALTSDMICFFFIPLQYLFFAASTYVWIQYLWCSFMDKGICLPTVALCFLVVYTEAAVRTRTGALEPWRPLAAHCLGYPTMSLGFGVKAYVGQRLKERRQRQVRAENEFYFQLLRDALPESALLEQNTQTKEECSKTEDTPTSTHTPTPTPTTTQTHTTTQTQTVSNTNSYTHTNAHTQNDSRHMNGSVRRRCARDHNGVCVADNNIQVKLDKLEKTVSRDKTNAQAAYTNGFASGPGAPANTNHENDEKHEGKSGGKPSKYDKKEASTVREEKKKHKNKDKDKENNDSHKNTEQTKELIIKDKEVESTKENNIKSNKDSNNHKEREREKREERDRELKEREREQREKELRSSRELTEELKRVRAELNAARTGEAEARRALAAANTPRPMASSERVALERRLSEERRARTAAEHQLLRARHAARTPNGECDNEWCRSRRGALEAELAALRRELQRARDRATQMQREIQHKAELVRTLEARQARQEEANATANANSSPTNTRFACAALQERASYLERSLSAETRVKLDLLSALGDAKRHMRIQEGVISRQEKEIEELKAQMLAVMPTEFVTPVTNTVSKLRLSDGSPLDPNASVYTPKQLCSDA